MHVRREETNRGVLCTYRIVSIETRTEKGGSLVANKNNNGLDGSCTYSAVKSGVGRLEARPRFVALLQAGEMMMVDRDDEHRGVCSGFGLP